MLNNNINITSIPAEAASLILSLAIKNGIESNLPPEHSVATIEPSAYAFALLMRPVEWSEDLKHPLLFLVNRPWGGIVYNPNTGFIAGASNIYRREITSWLTWNYPLANRPAVKLKEAWMLVDVMNGSVQAEGLQGMDLAWNIWDASKLEGTDEKWSINGPAFAKQLKDMPVNDRLSLWDSIEAFWDFRSEFVNGEQAVRKLFNIQEDTGA